MTLIKNLKLFTIFLSAMILISFVYAEECTDDDGGINFYEKGETCSDYEFGEMTCAVDECHDDTRLFEQRCLDGKYLRTLNTDCEFGCQDGACIEAPVPSCEDSDGGINYEVKGQVMYETHPYYDVCRDFQGKILIKEWYCDDENMLKFKEIECTGTCEDGACLSKPTYTCTETDNGYDIYNAGVTTGVFAHDTSGNIKDYTDYCVSSKLLSESYCQDGRVEFKQVECEKGCTGSNTQGRCNEEEEKEFEDEPFDDDADFLYFYAETDCSHCVRAEDAVDRLEKEIDLKKISIGKLTDNNDVIGDSIAEKWNVKTVPTLVHTSTKSIKSGYISYEDWKSWVNQQTKTPNYDKKEGPKIRDFMNVNNEYIFKTDYIYKEVYIDGNKVNAKISHAGGSVGTKYVVQCKKGNTLELRYEYPDNSGIVFTTYDISKAGCNSKSKENTENINEKLLADYFFLKEDSTYNFYLSPTFQGVDPKQIGIMVSFSGHRFVSSEGETKKQEVFSQISNEPHSGNKWIINKQLHYDSLLGAYKIRELTEDEFNNIFEDITIILKYKTEQNKIAKNIKDIFVKELINPSTDEPLNINSEKDICKGCTHDDVCYSLGYRKEGTFCTDKLHFESQKDDNNNCSNAFECKSNICEKNQCGRYCDGCKDSNKNCHPFGIRVDNKFCNLNKEFAAQKSNEGSCSNNYECISNLCINSKCIEPSFLQKILDWFKNIFG